MQKAEELVSRLLWVFMIATYKARVASGRIGNDKLGILALLFAYISVGV